jgi:hypothetical protein
MKKRALDTKILDEEDFLGLLILVSRYMLQTARIMILLKE